MVGQMEMARRRIAVWSCYPRAHAIMHPATIKVTDMPPEGARSNSLRRPRARNELNGATYGRAMSSIVLPEGAQFDVCYLQARTVKDVLYLWTHSLKSKDKRLFPFLNPLCWVYILGDRWLRTREVQCILAMAGRHRTLLGSTIPGIFKSMSCVSWFFSLPHDMGANFQQILYRSLAGSRFFLINPFWPPVFCAGCRMTRLSRRPASQRRRQRKNEKQTKL